jgi:DNA-binding winged helix-turn-helix (wHTH) protein/tetratricopeptide (TPR) repeat protein
VSLTGAAHTLRGDEWLEFGCFRLDPQQKILWRDGQVVPLGPRVVQTFFVLAANAGEVVSKEDLIRQVWAETAVEENNLAHNIFVLRKALKEDPSGRLTIETVPRRGYRFCEGSPPKPVIVQRPEAHKPEPVISAAPDSSPAKKRRWGRLGWVLVMAALMGVAGIGLYLRQVRPAQGGVQRRSIAVLGLANLSKTSEVAWMSPAVSEILSSELGADGKLLTIPDENVARARAELHLENRNGFSQETLRRLRHDLSADLIVSGAYTVLPARSAGPAFGGDDPQVRLDLRVQDATTGETLETLSESGGQSSLFDLVARVGARVRQHLGVDVMGPEQAEQVRLSVSANPEALRLYAEGAEKMRAFDSLAARDLLQRAVEADHEYALAYSALAEAWMALGYDSRAEQAAKTAFQFSGQLGLEQKLLIEGRYREAAHQWPEAVSAYHTLFHAYPDNVEYGLRLARAQRLAAQYPNAQTTLQELRKLPLPFSSDPRIDLEESVVAESAGDDRAAQRAATSAEQKGRERGSSLLVARAKLAMPVVRSPAFVAAQQEARQACESLGDMDCVGLAWLRIGRSHTVDPSSRTEIERALAIFKQVDDQRRVGEAQSALSNFFLERRQFVEARRLNAAARRTCETIGDRTCITHQILNDGNIDSVTGDVAGAEAKYRQALALARETGEDQLIWGSLNNIASLLADYKGDLPQAEVTYRQLAEIDRKSSKEMRRNFTLSNLGAVLAAEGHLAEARRILTEVQAISLKRTGRLDFGSSTITLAQIDVAEGRLQDAEARLLPMAKVLDDDQHGFASTYYDQIAAVQLEEKKVADAQRTAARARELLRGMKTGFDVYHLAITEEKIAAALHPNDVNGLTHALARLREIGAQCRRNGFGGLELEARLAEGEIAIRSTDTARARALLTRLELDANAKGFGLIARRAASDRMVTLAQGR